MRIYTPQRKSILSFSSEKINPLKNELSTTSTIKSRQYLSITRQTTPFIQYQSQKIIDILRKKLNGVEQTTPFRHNLIYSNVYQKRPLNFDGKNNNQLTENTIKKISTQELRTEKKLKICSPKNTSNTISSCVKNSDQSERTRSGLKINQQRIRSVSEAPRRRNKCLTVISRMPVCKKNNSLKLLS